MMEDMSKPMLYPCANRVKMPHVGADETTFKPVKDNVKHHPFAPSKAHPHSVSKYYVKKISNGLSFSEDVVKERCFHTLPYSEKYLLDTLDVSDLITRPPPTRKIIGRHDTRGSDKRHMPCHIQQKSVHKLKPIKPNMMKKAIELHQKAQEEENRKQTPRDTSPIFLTESNQDKSPRSPLRGKPQSKWDEYLLAKMSQTTSEWIVKQRVPSGEYQHKLESFLEDRYGTILDDDPELVRDTISEADFSMKEPSSKGRWRKADENMLDRVRKVTKEKGLVTDPYADESKAAFYRLPAGFRRAKKYHDKEEAGAINTTAYNIDVKPYTAPPPPTLKDFINPEVGDKLYNTDNRFEQEWLTGTKQIYQKGSDQSEILLETNNRYRKVLVKECPQPPELWFPQTDGEKDKEEMKKSPVKRFERGLHRWKALPQPIDDTAENLRAQPIGGDTDQTREQESKKKTQSRTNLLLRMVDDWRAKWHLDMRYADATPEDLIRDMADIHPHIRLKAITTCARAAEYSPPPEMGIQLDTEVTKLDHVKLLPDKLFVALELCLEDDNLQVRRAAAIALYTLEKPLPAAETILRQALRDENAIDRWTVAQCLAYFGECDSEVVSELISQLLTTEDNLKHEQARALLSRLSQTSTLVHSLIGEQLNSSSWRHRVMACRVLPKLEGRISKDLVNKLTHLMWVDWHHEVRKMAAQTLGKTGHGKHVHDQLREKILQGNEKMRVEAVSKVGHLGIMTAKLLPAFLHCFEDSYVSVRMEACVAAGNLSIHDEQVLEGLVSLATYDPIWKVKALAIQALGTIGVLTKTIRECILWAFRFEDQAGVRVEACHTIIKFQLKEPDVAQILQDRYLVETSDIVKDEIVEALKLFDISPSEDMDMVAQIKTEVRKLCTRNNICAQITQNEEAVTHEQNIERMIYRQPGTPKMESPRYRPVSRHQPKPHSDEHFPRPPGTSESSRPYSQEADREVQAMFDRYDEDGSSHVTNLDVTLPESRPDTAYSQKTTKSEFTFDEGSGELNSETHQTNGTELASRPKSYVTFASPEAEEFEVDTSGSGLVDEESEVQEKRSLGEAQTYVEISGDPEVPGDFSEHVVAVAHSSPDAGTSDVAHSSPDAGTSEMSISDLNLSSQGTQSQQLDVMPNMEESVMLDKEQSEVMDEMKSKEPNETQCEEPNETQSKEPNEMQSKEPNEMQSKEPNETQSKEPNEMQSKEPNEIQYEEPSEMQSKEPNETQSNEPNETQALGSEKLQTSGQDETQSKGQEGEKSDNSGNLDNSLVHQQSDDSPPSVPTSHSPDVSTGQETSQVENLVENPENNSSENDTV